MINRETQQLIDQLRDRMAGMRPQDRMELVIQLTDGYSDLNDLSGLGIELWF